MRGARSARPIAIAFLWGWPCWSRDGSLRKICARRWPRSAARGSGRLGEWLVRQRSTSEERVTRTLGLQWGCPVLSVEYHNPEDLTSLVPRLFIDAFGALPLRVAAGKILYLGFEDRIDPAVALAVERMTGLRVETGLVPGSHFRMAHAHALEARFPPVELIEAATEQAMAAALARAIEAFAARPGAPGARTRLLLAAPLAPPSGWASARIGLHPRPDRLGRGARRCLNPAAPESASRPGG